MQFNPTTGLMDTSTFPTNPADETAARKQFMDLFIQVRDNVNSYGVVNVMDYNASGSAQTTTGSIAAGSNQLTAASAIDFKKGQGISVAGNKEVAGLTMSAAPTASANVTVTLDGVATNVAVTIGVAEVASLNVTAAATAAGNVTVTLNGVATNVAVALNDTAIQVADKIRAVTFTGWTTGGTTGTATVTFTATTVGNKTDATYATGTTGAAGAMTTTTQGVNADTAISVADKIRAATFTGWTTGGTSGTAAVTFTANSTGNKTDGTYSAGTTGATGTMSTTTQGSADLVTTISTISGTTFTLADNAAVTVTNVAVQHDESAAFASIMNAVKVQNQPKIIFPPGIFRYTTSPNWALQDLQIIAHGQVRLRYAGTGNAFILDGSTQPNSNVYNMKVGRFIIEAPDTAQDGVYINAVHHSELDFKVLGSGANYAGLHLLFSVCNVIKLTVSSNEEGWYQGSGPNQPTTGARPKYGLQLGKLSVGNIPSYNTFLTPVIEHTIEGGYLDDSLGNIFIGGTMEGCADIGLWLTANAGLNKFFGTDFEVNTGEDIVCSGFENEFHAIDSTKRLQFTGSATRNRVFGGNFKNILLQGTTSYNIINGSNYNRQLFDGTTGTLTDAGTFNTLMNLTDVKNNKRHNRPATASTLTVGVSPFTYQNTSGNEERILIYGGTVSVIDLAHGAGGDSAPGANWSYHMLPLGPGDSIIVTYTTVPTMRKYTT